MTKTEQAMIDLLVRRHEAMQSKHLLRKEIATIKRDVAAKVASGDFEGINHHWVTEDDSEDGEPGKKIEWYTTDEMEDLYRDYHGCRYEITCILASINYQCKKHIEQKKQLEILITKNNELKKETTQ